MALNSEASASLDLRFEVFARSWALCILLGMLSQGMTTSPDRVAVVGLATVVFAVPTAAALLLLGVSYVVHYGLDRYDDAYVHPWLLVVASLTIAFGLALAANRDAAVWRRRFVGSTAPVVVALAGTWLFFAGFAKLNDAFLDPETSCAPVFYSNQLRLFPFSLLPRVPWAGALAIPFTLVCEMLGGLLLLHWRTRKVGFVVMTTFLLVTGTNPLGRLYEFTSIFVALPSIAFDWRVPRIEPRPRGRWLPLAVAVAVGVFVAMELLGLRSRFTVGRIVYAALVLFLAAAVALRGRAIPLRTHAGAAGALWGLYVVAVLHEMLPYVGLRNSQNLTMAATLAVGPLWSNHRIVRHVPTLPFNHCVVIERSSDSFLEPGYAWPDWAFYDYLARHPDVEATALLDGASVRFDGRDSRVVESLAAVVLKPLQTPAAQVEKTCQKRRPKKKKTPTP